MPAQPWRSTACRRLAYWSVSDSARRSNDFANAFWIAFGWIDPSALLGEQSQVALELLQLADARSNLGTVAFDEL
jgi:hypothetical protein